MFAASTAGNDRLRRSWRWLRAVAATLTMGVPALPAWAQPAATAACVVARPPDSLWSLAQCCSRNLQSNPSCRYYSNQDGFIILKDNSPAKPAAYLIIPTTKVTGIEDRRIFLPPVADFWADGWQEAGVFLKRPAAETGLAINSEFGRTQNQLHIHISCVRRNVVRVLAAHAPNIGANPAQPVEVTLGPQDNLYRVVKTTSLTKRNPFELVATMPGAADDMKDQSIAVIGSNEPGVYYVLDTRHHGSNPGAAEELLDQTCRS
jgi:CDP-diacylglycerol pyrophosphatase